MPARTHTQLMPRAPRLQLAGGTYHVTARGNRQQPVFASFGDHAVFLDLVGRVVERYDWSCLAYCLMPNHYHLVVMTRTPTLSLGIQMLNGRYAQTFNRHHEVTGHLFQGRFHATLLERQSHLLEVCRYVVLNPVRAHLCRTADEWRWSSYRATAGLDSTARFLAVGETLALFGRDHATAERAFRRFVYDG